MAKKIRLIVAVMAVIVLFTSCKGPILDVGNLLTPPVFFSEQNKIIDALKSSVGNEIELEYPSGGDYRSAFILYDIDKDGSNEAIVFYRLVKPDMLQNMVHINLLDTKKGEWVSVCDIIGEATSIDKVAVGTFLRKREILIGWNQIRDREKKLVCYSFNDGMLERDFETGYVEFAVSDFYGEAYGDELITVNYVPANENLNQVTQHARLIRCIDGEFKITSTTPLDIRVQGFRKCIAGKVNPAVKALFLDGIIDTNTINTQVLIVSSNGKITNPLLKDGKVNSLTERKSNLTTSDINLDGILEIPRQEEFLGYSEVPESERLYKTVWQTVSEGSLAVSNKMYIGSSIRLTLESKSADKLTVKYTAARNELVFYEFNRSLEASQNALFSVKVSEKELFEAEEGYHKIAENDYIVVTAKIINEQSSLSLGLEELEKLVYII